MNPLTVNPAIVLDNALRTGSERIGAEGAAGRRRQGRRSGRAAHAARTARVALERAGL